MRSTCRATWRESLGLTEKTPNPPCRLGLYRNSPKSPPAPAGRWRFEPETPRTQIEASAIAIGPVIYVTGGSPPGNLHRVTAFDTRTRKWSDPTSLPTGLNHSQVATHDGKLYLAGGYLDGEDPTANVWQYDPETDRWTQLPDLLQPSAAGAVVAIGDKLYVAERRPADLRRQRPDHPLQRPRRSTTSRPKNGHTARRSRTPATTSAPRPSAASSTSSEAEA